MEKFIGEYKTFAMDTGLSQGSAESYISYLRNACKNLTGIADHLERIARCSDWDQQAMFAEQINAAITAALNDNACTINKKTLRNSKSAVALLIAFLSDQQMAAPIGATVMPPLGGVSEYSRQDLKLIFLSRLKTQDRLSYSYGVFAARILCKIAAKNKVKLFEEAVNNIKFLYSPSKNTYFRLKEIDKLVIATDGHAYIEKNGLTYPVYTETYQKGHSGGFEIANITVSRQLSLDHDIPMFDALQSALVNMPEYHKLSDDVKRIQKANPKDNASALSKKYFDQFYPQLCLCEASMLKEMKDFLDNMQLTVMHASYNSSKNKNTP